MRSCDSWRLFESVLSLVDLEVTTVKKHEIVFKPWKSVKGLAQDGEVATEELESMLRYMGCTSVTMIL